METTVADTESTESTESREETPRQALIRTAAEFRDALGAALGALAKEERHRGLDVLDLLDDFAGLLRGNDRNDRKDVQP